MKSAILVIIIFFLSAGIHAQHAKPIQAKLDKATVYLQGAMLQYGENVNLPAGTTDIVFENISPYISDASLQATSRGGVVMDVKHLLKYKEKVAVTRQYDKEIERVTDSIEEANYDKEDILNKLIVLNTEKNMLLNSRMMKGEFLRDSLPLLREAIAFLKEKLNSIYEQELRQEKAQHRIEKKLTKMEERRAALTLLQNGEVQEEGEEAQPVHQVVVTMYSETTQQSQIRFNYYIEQANWIPNYDLQATSSTNSFQLKYFANITQQSGLDWKNTALTLSTSTPNESNMKPQLNPWYLGFIQFRSERKDLRRMSNSAAELSMETITIQKNKSMVDTKAQDQTMDDYVSITENLIRTEYEIKLPYTINGDGKAHKVLINQRDVPMLLEFAAVPKMCNDAFLLARITGWEDMNIIPGNARLYYDGAFVGQTYFNAGSTDDTLQVNLGRDKTIALTRKKIKEKYNKDFFGDDKTETRTIELVVRNTKNVAIEMVLEDQIPVVRAEDAHEIRVVLLNGGNASVDEATGMLKWKLKMGSKETKKLRFTYEIRYPKNKPVAGL